MRLTRSYSLVPTSIALYVKQYLHAVHVFLPRYIDDMISFSLIRQLEIFAYMEVLGKEDNDERFRQNPNP